MNHGQGAAAPETDAVTGALPRALLSAHLDRELARAAPVGARCAVFLFDVDFFKTVNDAYGHLRGDEILRALCDRVKGIVRPTDALFRYGGDEFVLVLPDTDAAVALRLALRLTEEIKTREFAGEPALHVSVSLGVASYPDDGTDALSLLGCADRRNYLAKRRGRGGAVADDADTGAGSASSRLWERDAALGATHEFLTRLHVEGRGALRVRGEPGAGHTRFLTEVRKVATLRGFAAVPVAAVAEAPAEGAVLLLADVSEEQLARDAVRRLAGHPDPVGIVFAGPVGDGDPGLPVLDTVELAPWSPAALRIWLRATLRGEPSRTLFNWLLTRSGGLPARAGRELDRLRERDGLVAAGDGGWTVAPALLDRPRRRSRLPAPMTALVGRRTEHDRVVRMLAQGRLATLVGPGGIGKTRLSLSVAAAIATDFEDGAAFVPLADTTGTDLVVAAIAHALAVAEVPGEPLLETVVEHLSGLSLLLVLDNFEQVLDAGGIVGELLAAAPGVTILVTSRERLSIYGEQVYQVPPLGLPDLGSLPATATGVERVLADSPAVALFEQRAAATADFALTPRTLPVVARLCHLLDGLPLAIELAAAHTDRWHPDDLLVHLAHHLDELGSGPRDLPDRQRTLRGAIDWSFVLLDPPAQRLFTTLAVFAGGWDAESALAVAEPAPPGEDEDDQLLRQKDLASRLAGLAAKNLLVAESESGGGGQRYRMLETIRAYAAARLAGDAGSGEVHDRHAARFVDLAQRSAIGLTGPEQAEWAERLEREYPNLRAAIHWTLSRGAAGDAAGICLGLWRYWRNGSHLREGREWLDRVLAAEPGLAPDLRARILYPAAILAATQDDHAAAALLGGESLTLAESAGDLPTAAQARNALGIAAIGAGGYAEATEHFRHSLALWRDLDQPHGTAMALGNLTKLALRLGDIAAANGYADQCLALERAAGNTRGILLGLECVGQIRLAEGDVTGARTALGESLALSRTLGDGFGEAMALHQLGLAAKLDGDRAESLRLLVSALHRRHELGDREDLAVSLDCLAGLALHTDPALAVRFVAAAEALRERHRLPVPPESDTHRAQTLDTARELLDGNTFASAWAGGRTAPIDVVVDQAVDLAPAPVT